MHRKREKRAGRWLRSDGINRGSISSQGKKKGPRKECVDAEVHGEFKDSKNENSKNEILCILERDKGMKRIEQLSFQVAE